MVNIAAAQAGGPTVSADYEVPLMTVTDSQGSTLRAVRHFRDGIIVRDPAKVIIYDADGRILAETPYFRDVCAIDAGRGRLCVFGVHFLDPLHRGWFLRERTLVRMPPLRGALFACLASLHRHPIAYSISAFLCVTATISFLSRSRDLGTWDFDLGGWEWAGIAWVGLDFVYGPLSVLLLLSLSLLISIPFTRSIGEIVAIASVYLAGMVFLWLIVLIPFVIAWVTGPQCSSDKRTTGGTP
jgi:hypothetical protein